MAKIIVNVPEDNCATCPLSDMKWFEHTQNYVLICRQFCVSVPATKPCVECIESRNKTTKEVVNK